MFSVAPLSLGYVVKWLLLLSVLFIEDEVSCTLCLSCGDDGKLLIVLQYLQPTLNVGRRVLYRLLFYTCVTAEHGCSKLSDEFLLAVVMATEVVWLKYPFTAQS